MFVMRCPSWTTRFSIEANFDREILFSCYLGAGLFSGKNHTNNCVFLYDSDEKKETKYTESLVSLDGFEQIE